MTVTLGADAPIIDQTEEWEPLTEPSTLESFMGSPTPITDLVTPRRRGRPPGSKNRPKTGDEAAPSSPKSVDPSGAAFNGTDLPRRRGRPRKTMEPSISADQIGDIVVLAHTMAASLVGPEANVTPEDAKKIGDAMVPVLQDWGIVVAGKIVHLVILFAAIGAVEGPIALRVLAAGRARAIAARSGMVTMKGQPTPQTAPNDIGTIAKALGLEVGTPNVEDI